MFDYIADGQMTIFDLLKPEEPQTEPESQYCEKEYRVIRTDEMKVIHERNFVEICTDSRICIMATVKLLEGNMVYYKEWYTYPFLDACESEKEANKRYTEHLNNILNALYQPPRFEVNIPVELEDMYLCVNGNWSCFEYTNYNGAVTLHEEN